MTLTDKDVEGRHDYRDNGTKDCVPELAQDSACILGSRGISPPLIPLEPMQGRAYG